MIQTLVDEIDDAAEKRICSGCVGELFLKAMVESTGVEGVCSYCKDESKTFYYLPGATGWSTTFGGAPTALWLPQIQINDGSIGVQSNQFGFNINWASRQSVEVDACTNLVNPDWQAVRTTTLTNSSYYFSDPQWTNYPARFYRLSSP